MNNQEKTFTRRDYEEALDKMDNLQRLIIDLIALSGKSGGKAFVEWSVKNEFKIYKQALQDKIASFEQEGE